MPRRLILVTTLLALVAGCTHVGQTASRSSEHTRLRVIDGDTVEVLGPGPRGLARIVGIDAPELGDTRPLVAKMADRAAEHLRAVLIEPVAVSDAYARPRKDEQGRRLIYLTSRGRDVGLQMIRDGYAQAFRTYPHPRMGQYERVEAEARADARGLWNRDLVGAKYPVSQPPAQQK